MDEWHVGDPADWGDSVGVPDIPYMGYLNDDEEDDDRPVSERMSRVERLQRQALYEMNNNRLHDAFGLISEAISYDRENAESYNIKAIILEEMGQVHAALYNYRQALKRTDSPVVKDNKARLLCDVALYYTQPNQKALDYVNEALKLTSNDEDRTSFLHAKRRILEKMGREREAYVCSKLANNQIHLVDEFERQSKILKETKDTIICIAGTDFYEGFRPFGKGIVVDLVKEPDNDHDPDAIRVEINARTVGYVANSQFTLIKEAQSASQIKGTFESRTKAKVMFVYMERYLLSKLLRSA